MNAKGKCLTCCMCGGKKTTPRDVAPLWDGSTPRTKGQPAAKVRCKKEVDAPRLRCLGLRDVP